ncbi:hypothetical protein POTOM_056173 [Populus tomentosa]|uniref:Uncharacterized protein n=1 Tax=Populus tomentosa TaxID=118781 RepID=A0A8X8C4M5_POPTO|nr:hypothetical protein POTOM_056173 [Populus tomentosa]
MKLPFLVKDASTLNMKTSIDSEEQGEVLSEKDIDETSAANVSISTTTEIYASKTSPDNAGRQYWLILGYIDRTLTTTSSESDSSLERAPKCLKKAVEIGSAVVLLDENLDADEVYQKAVAFPSLFFLVLFIVTDHVRLRLKREREARKYWGFGS